MSGSADDAPARGRDPLRSPALRLLAGVLILEALALAVLAVVLLVEVFTATPDSYVSAIGVTVLSAIGAGAFGFIGLRTLRGQPWVRGAIVTLQLIQVAIAIGCFQGIVGRADLGWALLIPALVALVLLFTKAVVVSTTRPDR